MPTARSLAPAAALLPLSALIACATPPPPRLDTLPDTVDARAARCADAADRRPDDLRALRCERQAMLRLGRRAALVERLRARRITAPKDGLRWYAEGAAHVAAAPEQAAALFEECRATDEAWCLAGLTRVALARGDAPAALATARIGASLRPDAPGIAALEAIALARAGDLDRARERVDPLLIGWPDDPDVQLARGTVALLADAPGEARDAIERILTQSPDAAAPHLLRAELHRSLGDHEAAAAALRRAVAADREAIGARAALGAQLVALDRPAAAVDVLAALAEQRPDDPAHAIALGEALLATGAADRARAWAEAARALDPEDGAALQLAARAAIAAGDVAAGLALRPALYAAPDAVAHRLAIARALALADHFTRAESEFAAAVIHHPDDPAAWLAFARWFAARDKLDRAEGLLRQAIDRRPQAAELHVALADVFERQGNRAGARLALSVAARLQPEVAAHEDELARVEFLDGELIEALARWEKLIVAHPGADRPLRRLSAAYRALDEPEKALDLLERLVERHPDDAELKGRLGETLLEAGRKDRAVGVLEAALAGGADADRLRPLLATALADTGRTDAAADLFERALAEDPGNRPLRLTFAAFRAATGDRAGAVELYRSQLARDPADLDARSGLAALLGPEVVAAAVDPGSHPRALVDAELAALAAAAPPADDRIGGAVLRDERRVVVDARGVAEIHHRRAILVQRPAGVERYATAGVPFHVDQPPTVVRARTVSPDGEVLPVKPGDRSVQNPGAGTLLYGDGRRLELRFSGLEPGAIVDYEVITRRPHPDIDGPWWDGYVLANADPTVQARYTLDLPADSAWMARADGMGEPAETVADGRRTLIWSRRDLPAWREGVEGPLPSVRVSNLASWAEVDRWYHALFGPRSAATPSIAHTAQTLTAGAKTRRQKVAAIYRHVERNIRYLGVEFGIGAYQPRPPESTLAQGRGDCKDMTALMVALLAALDIEAHPALTKPRGQGVFDPGHPSPGQFSHVLLYVPDPDGDLWLDATAGLGTLDAVPAALRGRHALIIDGEGGDLVRIPAADVRRNRLVESRTYRLTPTGGGTQTSVLELTGDLAGHARRRLLTVDGAARDALLSAPGHLLDQGRIPDRVGVQGLDDPAAPVVLTASVEHRDLVAVRLDGALVQPFDISVFTGGSLARYGSDDQSPAPRHFTRALRLEPPPGYRFDWPPLAAESEGPIALDVSEERGEGVTTITARMRIEGGGLDREDRDALVETARRLQAVLEVDLAMVPGEGFDRVAFIRAIIAERPGQEGLRTYLGQALLEAERPFEATMALLDALEQDPEDEQARLLLKLARMQLGTPAEVEQRLRARATRPGAPPATLMALAALLAESGRAAEAAALLAEHVTPESPVELWAARVDLLVGLERYDEAAQAAETIGEARPAHGPALSLRARVAEARGQQAEAIVAWRRALRASPENPMLLNNLAWSLRDLPTHRMEALTLAEKAAGIDPEAAPIWDTLAELRFRSGMLDGALEASQRAIDRARDRFERAEFEERRAKYEAAQAAEAAPR